MKVSLSVLFIVTIVDICTAVEEDLQLLADFQSNEFIQQQHLSTNFDPLSPRDVNSITTDKENDNEGQSTTSKLFQTIMAQIKDRNFAPFTSLEKPEEVTSRRRTEIPLKQTQSIRKIWHPTPRPPKRRRSTTTVSPTRTASPTKTASPTTTASPITARPSDDNDLSRSNFNNPHFLPNRSGIVHLFEWKFLDVAQECEDFLGPKGFAGVQVSPVHENLIIPNRPWYERYQPISYEINSRSGDSADFLEMTSRCNNVGVRIYVDVVLNHMAANFPGTAFGTAGTYANPKLFYFPGVPYNKEDFHQPPCPMTNLSNPINARNCEMDGLHDLDQSKENVRWSIILFLNKLIALGATGFRVDASKHMWPEDLKYIYDRVNNLLTDFVHPENSRPFIYQEVGDEWKFNYTHLGAVTEFAHPINMADVFKNNKNVTILENYGRPIMGMLPSEHSLTFVDNHDLQRKNPYVLTYKNRKEFTAAYAFTLGIPYGIPRVISSFEFDNDQQGPPADNEEDIITPEFDENEQCTNGWVCEHRWNAITNMIEFRNVVGNAPIRNWWSDGQGVASFCRGDKGFILINTGRKDFNEKKLRVCLKKGTYCDIISGKLVNGNCTGKKVEVGNNRRARIELSKSDTEAAIVLHVNAKEN